MRRVGGNGLLKFRRVLSELQSNELVGAAEVECRERRMKGESPELARFGVIGGELRSIARRRGSSKEELCR
jgi:hypothetical protein